MPSWILVLLKLLIQFGGPTVLNLAKKWLEGKYPAFAAAIEQLISDLQNPVKSNSASRKAALANCNGVACQSDLKE